MGRGVSLAVESEPFLLQIVRAQRLDASLLDRLVPVLPAHAAVDEPLAVGDLIDGPLRRLVDGVLGQYFEQVAVAVSHLRQAVLVACRDPGGLVAPGPCDQPADDGLGQLRGHVHALGHLHLRWGLYLALA